MPEALVTGPAPAAVATSTTTSGLLRRGERKPVEPDVVEEERPEPAPADEPEVAPATASTETESADRPDVPAAGFGGLAVSRPPGPSLYTVAAHQGRREVNGEATQERPQTNGEATAAGLVRRVPGAQRPDAGLAARTQEPAAAEPTRSSPEDVYSFLSNFQSGVARGRADAATDAPTNQEDGR